MTQTTINNPTTPINNSKTLIDVIGDFLGNTISIYAKETFLGTPIIQRAKAFPSPLQRNIVNQYFISLLLSWRSKNEVPVFNMLSMLCNDGDDENWMRIFGTIVLPFLRDNSILGSPLIHKEITTC